MAERGPRNGTNLPAPGERPASSVAVSPRSPGRDLPAVLRVEELANLLRISRASAYRLVREGDIPGVRRIGRSVRISAAAVLHWLDQGRDSLEGETKL